MRTIVRKQAAILGLGMAAAILSVIVADAVESLLHGTGLAAGFVLFSVLIALILRYRPDGWPQR